ncbi:MULTISPECIES: cytochrome c oxidase subunit I [unclassified Sphingobium]|uniref:cytochrome c oxidase subunit I n=1 Tax=unclassified Sphingobium TaxID=2611147 RepID=UPI0022248C80|nr:MULTISPECIES: cytochrome c oxidase subunit I [unclassified Sphingobium]MCW2395215.1 cytochrome c oxidase subunit I+III [Sphingobium sp. B8D3B]MCW2418729.1 cytochrome c oxidase subunit I+III [Sphingobium sp. B8D3C]
MKALQLHRALERIWGTPRGWRGTISTVNHSVIGVRLMVTAFIFFLIGGLLAMLIRAQLATPGSVFVGPDIYNQLFTMHGSIMMFLFAIPMFEGFAMYMLPKMLGARDLAFPRITAYGWWCYLFGGTMLIVAMLLGVAPDAGWFMYTPLSSKPYSPGINSDFWLLGITFVEISAMVTAVDIVVSILKLRAPGMSLDRMPLFAWYMLVTALMMLIGFPPLILGSILLELERAFGWPFFDAARGGDSLLWQHLFWLFGHPEVYIIFLPAAGAISTILPVMARTRILGYGWIVAAILALGFLSFGLWVHHMFTVGIPHMALAFFSAASTLVAVPTGVQIFAWLGTLWAGRPQMKLPMLYLIGFFVTFVMGGLTGVMVAMVPFNWQAHDSAFVTAHLHYVLFGGFVFPMLAAAYYWLGHFTGRQYSYTLGKAAFWLIFTGFHLTFFLMHLVGLLGQPRRIDSYPEGLGWTGYNLLSSVGGFVMASGVALFVIDIALQIFHAPRTRRNPWNAGTLEWAMMLPPPSYNIASLPHVDDREPLEKAPDLALSLARGEGYLAEPRHGWRETLAVDTASGRVEHIVVLPGNTTLPLWTAMVTGSFFLLMLFKLYILAPVPLILLAALGWRWAWLLGDKQVRGALPIGHGVEAPPHAEIGGSPGWWGSVFLLFANGTFFGALLFGHAFLWIIAPNWPPPALVLPSLPILLAGIVGAGVAALFGRRLRHVAIAGGGLATLLAALIVTAWLLAPAPTLHAYGAVVAVLLGYAILHAALALLIGLFVWQRRRAGFVAATHGAEPRIARLWADYAIAVCAITLACTHLPGLMA